MSFPEAFQRATDLANFNGNNYIVIKKANGDYESVCRSLAPINVIVAVVEAMGGEVVSEVTIQR